MLLPLSTPQEEYYVTHQCFLTNRALYLLIWNVEDGQRGIDSLSVWLQNMQVSLITWLMNRST